MSNVRPHMYRVPPDLDLSFCAGHSLNQVAIGKYDVQFKFESGVTLMLRSEGEVLQGGNVVASWTEEAGWSSLAFVALLNQTVIHARVPDERTIELQFPEGFILRVYDNSDQFESMQIFGPGQELIVI
jgi:hypothetical protein